MTPANPNFTPVACRRCGETATRVALNPSGGQRYRCRACRSTFVHGGPGKGRRLPAYKSVEVVQLIQSGLSIRAAARQAHINKTTGRAIAHRLEERVHRYVMEHGRLPERDLA